LSEVNQEIFSRPTTINESGTGTIQTKKEYDLKN
jgi:hypothetical protein